MTSVLSSLPSDELIDCRSQRRSQRSKSDDIFDDQSINQSINQTNNPSDNQSINQSINRLIAASSATQSPSSSDREDDADSPVSSNENTPTNQSMNQSINQSTSQSTKRDPAAHQKALMRQIEYYFSNQNLWKDAYLLSEMLKNEDRLIDLNVIAGLKKVAKFNADLPTLIQSIQASHKLELNADHTMVKRVQSLPAYDQLKDAPRCLYVENLPMNSSVKSVKKMFAIFGKVTYVLRADQIDSAVTLNSPHVSPIIHASTPPMSPMLLPRLSLAATHQSISLPSTPTNMNGSMQVPPLSASDSIETPFSSAYVQFEKPDSMQRAVSMIQACAKSHSSSTPKSNERILSISNSHVSSPILGRRTLGSPLPSSRALGSMTNKPVTDMSSLLQKRGLGVSASSSPSQSSRRIGVQTSLLDMNNQVGESSPHSPMVLDASATHSQLPPVFATLTVMTKIDRLRDQSDDEEKKPKVVEKEADKVAKSTKLNSTNWRNLNYVAVETRKQPMSDDDVDEKSSKSHKQRASKKTSHITDDNILHISPKPSPRMSPATPIMAYPLMGHSPGNSPALLSSFAHPSSLPALDLNKPRFSLAKRTSVAAGHVASRFALGPDAPESKGFAGRGRGKPIAV